ncbi:MAG: hypothetical protein NTX59_00280 [Elusimicrobia bacterium]|nr:hypothetical protein [Elusimicrobiota bacterium]
MLKIPSKATYQETIKSGNFGGNTKHHQTLGMEKLEMQRGAFIF